MRKLLFIILTLIKTISLKGDVLPQSAQPEITKRSVETGNDGQRCAARS